MTEKCEGCGEGMKFTDTFSMGIPSIKNGYYHMRCLENSMESHKSLTYQNIGTGWRSND